MLLGRDLAQNLVLGAGSAAKIQGDLATDPGVFGSTGFGDGPLSGLTWPLDRSAKIHRNRWKTGNSLLKKSARENRIYL